MAPNQVCANFCAYNKYCANSGRQSEGIEEDGEELDLISKLEDMNLSKEPGRYSWVPSDIYKIFMHFLIE